MAAVRLRKSPQAPFLIVVRRSVRLISRRWRRERARLDTCSRCKVVSAPSRRQAASKVMATLPKESKQATAATFLPERRLSAAGAIVGLRESGKTNRQ